MDKSLKIRNIILYIIACGAVFLGVSYLLNKRFNVSSRLLYYDIQSRFTDNFHAKDYIATYICVTVIMLYTGYLLFSSCVLKWTINFRGYVLKIIAGGGMLERIILYFDIVCVGVLLFCVLRKEPVFFLKVLPKTIGHSFGMIDGLDYTGAYEAFEENYAAGQRVFEIDLLPTSDHRLVLRHKWNDEIQTDFSNTNIPTEAEFLKQKIYGYLTPLSFYDLCILMQKYSDMYIVTDTKYVDMERMVPEFEIMTDTLADGFEDIQDRIIVQVYTKEMFEIVSGLGYGQILFTLYNIWEGDTAEFTELCRYCVNKNIDTIMIREENYNLEIQKIADRYGIFLYLHTINDIAIAKEYIMNGVQGVYTDTIMPNDLED